jgi:hypothetical protein
MGTGVCMLVADKIKRNSIRCDEIREEISNLVYERKQQLRGKPGTLTPLIQGVVNGLMAEEGRLQKNTYLLKRQLERNKDATSN